VPDRFLIAFCALAVVAPAQWLNYPTPGMPRTPDGKPNLTAPAPKTPDGKPDLSGIWGRSGNNKYFEDLSADGLEIPMLPLTKALYQERRGNLQKGHPSERCLPHGVIDFDSHQTPRRIIQTPGIVAILFEMHHIYRHLPGWPSSPQAHPACLPGLFSRQVGGRHAGR
jgi:hypothetical protein